MLSGFSPGANSRRRGRASGRAVLYDRSPHPVKETRRLPFSGRAYPPEIGYGTCPGGIPVAGAGNLRGRARRTDPVLDPRFRGASPRGAQRFVGRRAAPSAGARASHHLLRSPQSRPLLAGRGQVAAGHLLRRGRPRGASWPPGARAPGGDRPLLRLGHRAAPRPRSPERGGRAGPGGAVRAATPSLARDRDAQPGRDDPSAGIDAPGCAARRQGPPHRPTRVRPGVDAPLPPASAGRPQGEHRPRPARRLRPAQRVPGAVDPRLAGADLPLARRLGLAPAPPFASDSGPAGVGTERAGATGGGAGVALGAPRRPHGGRARSGTLALLREPGGLLPGGGEVPRR